MKTLLSALLIALFFSLSSAEAQREQWREKVESQKVAYITSELDLSPEQAQSFWPLYNEHQEAKKSLLDSDTKKGPELMALSEEDAKKEIEKRLQTQKELTQLKSDYTEKYLDILPAQKVLALDRAEREFRKEMLHRMREHKGESKGARKQRRRD